jgi:hypothetical protein
LSRLVLQVYTVFSISLTIRFYEILNGVVKLKNNKNNFYYSEEKYNILLREVKVTKSVNVKKTVLMNDDFEVMYYVRYNELYYAHIATGHVSRHHIMYEVNSIYEHFNIESIYIGKNYHRIEKNI